jgi:hypothetical protein
MWRLSEKLKEIAIRLSDGEYIDYMKSGQSLYHKRTARKITDEEYVRWVFMLDEYFKGQSVAE